MRVLFIALAAWSLAAQTTKPGPGQPAQTTGYVRSYAGRAGIVVPQENDYTLDQLGDVAITNPINGECIVRVGGVWINSTCLTTVAWGAITGTLSNQTDLQNALNAKEGAIAAGTTAQYWRGDKSWQTLDKSAVGLGNVENTAVSTWAGSANLTTLGAVTAGSFPWANLTGVPATFAPSAHAASHQFGGADLVATATPGANAIPQADALGKLAVGWIPDLSSIYAAVAHTHVKADVTDLETITATPTPATVPKADGAGKLAGGWLSEVLGFQDLSDVPLTWAASGQCLGSNGGALTVNAGNQVVCSDDDGGGGGSAPGGSAGDLQMHDGVSGFAASGINDNGQHFAISRAPAASATDALWLFGNPLASGNANGTYLGINPTSYSGDFLNFQIGGVQKFGVENDGTVVGFGFRSVSTNPTIVTLKDHSTGPGAPGSAGQVRLYSIAGRFYRHANGGAETRLLDAADLGAANGAAPLDGSQLLPASNLPAVAVRTDQGQSYTAGQKQVFEPSATTAGARIVAAALPSTPVTGDLAVDSGDANKLKYYDGSAWQAGGGGGGSYTFRDRLELNGSTVDYRPNDTRVVIIEEEFLSGTSTGNQIGSSGMNYPLTCTGGGGSGQSGVWPNLGLFRLTTGSSSGNTCAVAWAGLSGSAFGALGNNTDKYWRFTWVGRLNTTANVRFRLGFGTCNTAQPSNMWGVRFDTSSGFADATNFRLFNRTGGGAESAADAGWAVDSSFHTVSVYTDATTAGKLYITFDDGTAKTICSAGCDLTATPHTADGTFCAIVVTDTTAQATLDNDFFAFKARVATGASNKRN